MIGESRSGTVEYFDAQIGLGAVDVGGRRFEFHCTAITDGSRTIDVGTAVHVVIGPAGPGRWEARAVTAEALGGDGSGQVASPA